MGKLKDLTWDDVKEGVGDVVDMVIDSAYAPIEKGIEVFGKGATTASQAASQGIAVADQAATSVQTQAERTIGQIGAIGAMGIQGIQAGVNLTEDALTADETASSWGTILLYLFAGLSGLIFLIWLVRYFGSDEKDKKK